MNDIAILVLAAGASSRMEGEDKLMQLVDGEPLLRRVARIARSVSQKVIVTLPVGNTARAKTLAGLDVTQIEVQDSSKGMSVSLRYGIKALAGQNNAVLILLADMPDVTQTDLQAIIIANLNEPDVVVRAKDASGQPGHPVIFPSRLFPALERMSGDQGARDILKGEEITYVPLPGRNATTDLDTPEDWAAWRKANPRH